MRIEDWKKLMMGKSLDVLLLELLNAYGSYEKESHEKWETLRHASLVTDNFKGAIEWAKEEADAQRERYEWLLNYIYESFEKIKEE